MEYKKKLEMEDWDDAIEIADEDMVPKEMDKDPHKYSEEELGKEEYGDCGKHVHHTDSQRSKTGGRKVA